MLLLACGQCTDEGMLRLAALFSVGVVLAVPTQRRALHPYDHCTPNDPAFADLCQGIEDTFDFDTPGADQTACEAASVCTYVPPPDNPDYAPDLGSACDTAGMASHCVNSVHNAEGCFECVRRNQFGEMQGGDCTESEINDFCINGNNPCDTFDCGGYAEGHCAAKNDDDQDACDAVVEAGGWGQDADADRTACQNVGLTQTGRTGTMCDYSPGALKGTCEWAPGDRSPTCRCRDHWRSEIGDTGGPCTVHCTGDEDDDPHTGCRTTPEPTDVDKLGHEEGNMNDPSIMTCVAGVRALPFAGCLSAPPTPPLDCVRTVCGRAE